MRTSTKDSWKIKSLSVPKVLQTYIEFNEEQLCKLKQGLIPNSMDDKWFIYYENEHLHLHRSWTGNEIYRAKIESVDIDIYRITEFLVERNNDLYSRANDEMDISSFNSHVRYLTERVIQNPIKNGIIGLIVGDALGVPYEFRGRESMKRNPITEMIGYGTYNQPPGTWSDDSSLTLSLCETLINGLEYQKVGENFVQWLYNDRWTPHGSVFDVGISTKEAIKRIHQGEKAELAGNFDEQSNGNGSLMRILPILFEIQNIRSKQQKYEIIKQVSSITHAHVRSCLACFYYIEFAAFISHEDKYPITEAYKVANHSFLELVNELEINSYEVQKFGRIINGDLIHLNENDIFSTGYVIHTLEASIWCLLNSKSYQEAVLKAINLGDDTDTTGAVTGGLAGLYYGLNNIPQKWIEKIARIDEIDMLLNELSDKYKIARC